MRPTRTSARAARQLFRRCRVDGRTEARRVRLVAHRIATSRRRNGLALLSAFQRLVRLDRDRHRANVESAVDLNASMRKDIETRLEGMYGPGLDCLFRVNPALVGGVRIKVGSDVYDGSVRARLGAIEERLND